MIKKIYKALKGKYSYISSVQFMPVRIVVEYTEPKTVIQLIYDSINNVFW